MVYQYVINSYINIFYFQLNIYYHPSRPYVTYMSQKNNFLPGEIFRFFFFSFKGTDQTGTFMSLKCVVYYANCRGWHQSSKIQVVP